MKKKVLFIGFLLLIMGMAGTAGATKPDVPNGPDPSHVNQGNHNGGTPAEGNHYGTEVTGPDHTGNHYGNALTGPNNIQVTEPGILVLLGSGLLGLALFGRKRFRK